MISQAEETRHRMELLEDNRDGSWSSYEQYYSDRENLRGQIRSLNKKKRTIMQWRQLVADVLNGKTPPSKSRNNSRGPSPRRKLPPKIRRALKGNRWDMTTVNPSGTPYALNPALREAINKRRPWHRRQR